MSKSTLSVLVILMGVMLMLFQNCSPQHSEGSNSSSLRMFGSAKCDPALIQGFSDYHKVLSSRSMCLSCHVKGGAGNGAFADPDITVAFPVFFEKSEALVFQFATNASHKSGYTGPQNRDLLAAPREVLKAAEAEYAKCIQDEGSTPIGGDKFPTPDKLSASVPIPANVTANTVLQFDLANMVDAANRIPGGRLEITVRSFQTDQSVTGYDFSLPRIVAGTTALYVKNLALHLNGVAIPNPAGSTFQNIDRIIAAGTTRALYQSGAMRFVTDIATANTLSIAFERLELAPTMNFTPATFANLTAAANQNNTIRVFAQRCAGCHSGANPSGGFGLTANDYSLLFLSGMFRPYDLESRILRAVETNQMPPAAPLPDNEKAFIRGWIMDGAPRN